MSGDVLLTIGLAMVAAAIAFNGWLRYLSSDHGIRARRRRHGKRLKRRLQ